MSSIGAVGYRQPPLNLLRVGGEPSRGIGLAQIGAGGPPPPTRTGAVSSAQSAQLARAQASPFDTNPGARGTAANPPRGRTVDLRA